MQALGVTETGDQPVQERLRSYLRDKQLLLDNFEQVIDAAPLLAELLAGCPQLTMLVTSRVPLHLRGEKEIAVPPLALPPIDDRRPTTDDRHGDVVSGRSSVVTQYAAVQLFIQRALDIQPDFAVTNENAAAVAEICYRLDGLPLAIELAAARSKLFAPEALLARLSNRLALLTGGARDLPVRQQTLRNAIAWSYDLLEQSEQTLFTHLGVFVGGCALEAATAVCNGTSDQSLDVLDRLGLLVDNSLLLHVDGADGESRFVMLESIREYALERLEASGEAEAVWRRHAEYFLARAETIEPKLLGPEQTAWVERLERDLDNFRAVLGWALKQGVAETVARLSTALYWFWFAGRHRKEGLQWVKAALTLGTKCNPPVPVVIKVKMLNVAVMLMNDTGGGTQAQPLLEESLALSQETGDTHAIAKVLLLMREYKNSEGSTEAIELIEESLARYRDLGDQHGIGFALSSLAFIAIFWHGNYVVARARLEESRAIFRGLGFKHGLAVNLNVRARLAVAQQDYLMAQACNEERLAIEQELGNPDGIAFSLESLGRAALWLGDYVQATACFEESQALFRDMGATWAFDIPLEGLGQVAMAQADYETARLRLEECLAVRREQGDTRGIAWTLHWLGHVAVIQGHTAVAVQLLAESLALFQNLKNQRGSTHVIEGYAELALVRGLPKHAAQLCGAVAALREAISSVYEFPEEYIRTERLVAALRAQLDAATFDAAWVAGSALTLEQAIAEALNR